MAGNSDYDIGKAFQAIENELISSMIRNMERHKAEETKEGYEWEMWQAKQLDSLEKYKKDNRKKYGKKFRDINKKIEVVIRGANEDGQMEQEISILNAIKDGYPGIRKTPSGGSGTFFKANDRKLDSLIKATTDDMKKAETAILRQANDGYRKAIHNAQVYANTGAGTYEKAVDMATKDMLAAGLNCIKYKNGSRHTLADYADMALRTASKRAYLQGEGTKRQEWQIYTVIVNKRGNPCPKCLPFCGKVFIDDVWSGGPKDGKSPLTGQTYPLMSSAVEAGLYHPRCKDSHTTYFEGISSPPDGKYSKKEIEQIEKKNRQEAKKQYAKRQMEKYDRLTMYSLDEDNKRRYGARAKEWNSLYTSDISGKRLQYNPDHSYRIDIPGYNKDANDGLSKAAEKLARKGSEDGYEHMYLVNLENGDLEYYETNHDPQSVGYDFWKVAEANPTVNYAFIHNHNIASSLSETDLITPATTNNIPITIAVRNDGVVYYAKRIKMAPKGFYPSNYFKDVIDHLRELVRNGTITSAEYTRRREETLINCMLEEFYEGEVIINERGQRLGNE